jgi:endonuclease/exonuclease/phosphatase family metal-dependent hydrolase
MKNTFLAILVIMMAIFSFTSPDTSFEVMSFNIRYDNPEDGENKWNHRMPVIELYMQDQQPDIVGMQEVLPNQLQNLNDIMEGYNFISAGRNDGEEKGEACPVFYKTDRFELLNHDHFWLSETPDVVGTISWGAKLPRIVTWIELEDKESGNTFFVFNTHLSHVSEEARSQSVSLLIKQIKKIADDAPVILTGDFNTTRDTETYKKIVNNQTLPNPLKDAESLASHTTGGATSFNAFRPGFEGKRIDFIFVNELFSVLSHRVDEVQEDGVFISDHYPVAATVTLN